jgi:excisionase family DNA binding protein
VPEVAEVLRVPVSTVYEWIAERRLPHVKLGHRTLRVDRADLLAWIRECSVAARTEEVGRGPATTRRGVGGGLPVPGPEDGGVDALPPFDWAGDHEAAGG